VEEAPIDYMAPPRVLLIMPEQWPRALLRAALREAGYDAIGTPTLVAALYQAAPDPNRGPVRLVVVEQEALPDDEWQRIEGLRARAPEAALLLLAPRTRPVHEGPWAEIVQRPTSIADLVAVIERLLPLPPGLRRPLEESP
jgi:hypothetical protein